MMRKQAQQENAVARFGLDQLSPFPGLGYSWGPGILAMLINL
jgi:hypothetical protein